MIQRSFIFLFLPFLKGQGIECVNFVKGISAGTGISYQVAAEKCKKMHGSLPFFSSIAELEKYLEVSVDIKFK
jgi:hypothetical protein